MEGKVFQNFKVHFALVATVTVSLGMGWLFQQSTHTLCYSKLGFIYVGNILFWIASIQPVKKVFEKLLEKRSWKSSMVFIGLIVLIFNQLVVYFFVESLFSILYTCESNLHLSELIQTNGLLANVISLGIIFQSMKTGESCDKLNSSTHSIAEPICIKQNGSIHKLDPNEIVKLEADNNAVNIHTSEKRYVHYSRLKDWAIKLQDQGLVRVHRSFIVNKQFIKKYRAKPSGDAIVTLTTGEEIRVSRKYKSNLYEQGQLSLN